MPRDFAPGPDDLLCEQCGYALNGLPDTGNCPECGKPIAESTTASPRRPPAWETGRDRAVGRFEFTALGVLRSPRRFFRGMTAHGDTARSAAFGRLAIAPAVVLNTKTVVMHLFIMLMTSGPPAFDPAVLAAAGVVTLVVVMLGWLGLYLAVVRLTTVESRYWKMRLPAVVVRRALHYDAVYASALSVPPWAISLAYLCLVLANDRFAVYQVTYLYALSASVIVAGVGLFYVYATSMRSLMYANR